MKTSKAIFHLHEIIREKQSLRKYRLERMAETRQIKDGATGAMRDRTPEERERDDAYQKKEIAECDAHIEALEIAAEFLTK